MNPEEGKSQNSALSNCCYCPSLIYRGFRFADFRCDLYDLHKELVPYAEAWSWQKAIVKERKALNESDEDFADTVITLQHNPVYTLGTGSSEQFLKFDVNNGPFDLYRTERGGEVTYHGPGQVYIFHILFP